MIQPTDPLLQALLDALGEDVVFIGERIPAKAKSDESRTGHAMPTIYLRPRRVSDVSEALRLCNAARRPVTIQGGMTGLAGGANPDAGDVALSLDRLAGVEEVDRDAGAMTVWAGTVLETAQKAAEEAGFLLPIDLGARGSCQIGGNLANNAGGIRVISHGVTRDNVLGLEAVLADGTVISSLNKMQKNNTGYDLKQLFIGSEGTLGVITRAVLKLKPLGDGRETCLCVVESYEAAVALLHAARKGIAGLSAYEVMWRTFFDFSSKAEGLRFFEQDPPFVVLIEQSGAASIEGFLEAAFEQELISDAVIAQSEKQRLDFWKVREGYALDHLPDLMNYDVSLPIGDLDTYARAVTDEILAAYPDAHVSVFGHMGDSNIHLCISVGKAGDIEHDAVDAIVYDHVRRHKGAVSAEHGIGRLKRAYLGHSRSPEEIALMRAIKTALDPHCILNPERIFPTSRHPDVVAEA
ncbi:FAD/FMN-containing dehydrogenase [Rhizobium sp. SG_E_25_P2]|uniref:FAD-binding oxidoreductase n=1 Tax=Rhizobium sp. SG_E_25_P2 TaxID=2879942 RepID=UPI002476908A|nr:FAD-binding oxidoreductase [Rhizobium sp. SG_E_25_P2]MDH6268872.1 FAD/FMN-containing dehydrogenase [Rhizobium sp. SG_E_25_P2]